MGRTSSGGRLRWFRLSLRGTLGPRPARGSTGLISKGSGSEVPRASSLRGRGREMQVMTEVWSQGWAVSPGVGAADLSGRRKGTTSPPHAEQAPLISRRAEKEKIKR